MKYKIKLQDKQDKHPKIKELGIFQTNYNIFWKKLIGVGFTYPKERI